MTLGIDPTALSPFGDRYYDISGNRLEERRVDPFEARFMPVSTEETLSLPAWLMRGAIREDDYGYGQPLINGGAVGGTITLYSSGPGDDPYGEIFRVFHHFYDPYRDLPLQAPLPSLLAEVGGGVLYKAPDWGLGSEDAFSHPNAADQGRRNHFTISDAREAMYRALTGKRKDGGDTGPNGQSTTAAHRKAYWATVFRALGDVVHLVQDMAQPQHTRNDPHSGVPGYGHQSVYEAYIDARARGDEFYTLNGQPIALAALSYDSGYPDVRLAKYSDFFSTTPGSDSNAGQGLADYSNRGFFAAGTNLGDNDYPSPPNDRAAFAEELIEITPPGSPLVSVAYLRRDVADTLTGSTASSVRLTTESQWRQPLQDFASPEEAERYGYHLDRNNYDAMAELLIPRAVAYSAGLIDYFFRGRLEITLPQERVYGIVDNAALPDSSKGFKKIRLNLRNVTAAVDPPGTEGPYPQEMTDGELLAVVKYRRNPCFSMDYSGEVKLDVGQTPADVTEGKPLREILTWNGCSQAQVYEETEEEISVSSPLVVAPMAPVPTEVAATYTFDFGADEIPIDAVDVHLQVVYRGALGPSGNPAYQEPDAVVVSTKRISAPTPIVWTNTTDHVLDTSQYPDLPKVYRTPADVFDGSVPEEYQPGPISIEVKTGPVTEPVSLVNPSELPLGTFFRISVLTDPDSLVANLYVDNASLPEATKLGVGDYTGYDPDRNEVIVRPAINVREVFVTPASALNFPDMVVYYGACQFARGYPAGSQIDPNSQEEERQLSDSCRFLPPLDPAPQPVNVITFDQ